MSEQLQTAEKRIRVARGTLFFIGGISAIVGVYIIASGNSILGLDGSVLIDAALMLILGGLSFRYPLIALSLGLGLYLLGQVFIIIENPQALAKNFIMKGYIIYALAMGVKAAYDLKNIQKDADALAKIEEIGTENVPDVAEESL